MSPTRQEPLAAWKIFSEVLVRSIPEKPFFNAGEILAEIKRNVVSFGDSEIGERLA